MWGQHDVGEAFPEPFQSLGDQPQPNQSLSVQQVACGDDHTLCLTERGQIFAAGSGQKLRARIESGDVPSPDRSVGDCSFFCRERPIIWVWSKLKPGDRRFQSFPFREGFVSGTHFWTLSHWKSLFQGSHLYPNLACASPNLASSSCKPAPAVT